jgi:predicted transcriptional regulator
MSLSKSDSMCETIVETLARSVTSSDGHGGISSWGQRELKEQLKELVEAIKEELREELANDS